MSFLQRARDQVTAVGRGVLEAASQPAVTDPDADPAVSAPGGFRAAAAAMVDTTRDGLSAASVAISDPANQAAAAARARALGGKAKVGIASMVDKIDPDVFAEVIIKATSAQERINASLQAKGSPYRIGEVAIAVAFPLPNISFSIARVGDLEAGGRLGDEAPSDPIAE